MNHQKTIRACLPILGILCFSLLGCGTQNESDQQIVLIELQYQGGQIPQEQIPNLQILSNNTARLVTGAQIKEIQLSETQFQNLLLKATDPNFLALDSAMLKDKTRALIREQGSPMPRVIDASTPRIRCWTGKYYHEVSFNAPRLFLRHSGDNPDLTYFVDLLDELEKLMGLFLNN